MKEAKMLASKNIQFVGMQPKDYVIETIQKSPFMVFSSECYEEFPLTLLKAMAIGLAIIASDFGSRKDIVGDGITGLLFRVRSSSDLKEKVQKLINNPDMCADMGVGARKRYLKRYTPKVNYEMLLSIYNKVLGENSYQ